MKKKIVRKQGSINSQQNKYFHHTKLQGRNEIGYWSVTFTVEKISIGDVYHVVCFLVIQEDWILDSKNTYHELNLTVVLHFDTVQRGKMRFEESIEIHLLKKLSIIPKRTHYHFHFAFKNRKVASSSPLLFSISLVRYLVWMENAISKGRT